MSSKLGFERDWYLIVIGAVIGTLTALGAIGFMAGLNAVEHWSEGAQEYFHGWAGVWLLPLIPMVGALITGVLVHIGASEARGHGVPQVMKAIMKKKGVINPRVGLVKVLASICTVGSGGSAGAEGPIIQIGSTVGSFAGQRLGVSRDQMVTLLGCGAAAGIASVFNAPIAGVFFVLEILLKDFSLRTFTPIVVASVFSTATTQAILAEDDALFASRALLTYDYHMMETPSYFLLGIICGLVAVGFGKTLHVGESVFEKVRLHPIVKPVLGALLLGLLGAIFLLLNGAHETSPQFFGNGYATIRNLLDPKSFLGSGGPFGGGSAALTLLLALLVCKGLATVLTLASGGSGGVFAPSLFLGATAGGGLGLLLDQMGLLPAASSPAAYALVGMAAVVAASTHAPLTAILMLFELTRNPGVLPPIMLSAVVATVVAQLVDRDSIYTAKLRKTGDLVGQTRDQMLMRKIPVSSCKTTPLPAEPVYASDPLTKLIMLHAYHKVPDFVVVDQSGTFVGMVTGADMRAALIDREAIPLLLVAELVRTDFPVVSSSESLDTVMEKFARYDISSLPLVNDSSAKHPIGLITRAEVLHRYDQVLQEG